MSRPDDVLDLLLPEADSRVVRTARSVTHFLRLLSDDARPARAVSVCVDLDRARHEFDRHDRRAVHVALSDLVRHHLDAVAKPDNFAWHGEPSVGVQQAWATVVDYRSELEWLAGVPEPDETALAVLGRLLASLERVCAPAELGLWRARLARHTDGPRAAERLFRAHAVQHRGATGWLDRAHVAGAAECMLDRGAVREAHAWLVEHRVATLVDARLRQLSSWCKLCLGDFEGAQAMLAGMRPWSGPLPGGLAELRIHKPAWLACLSGKVRTREGRVERPSTRGAPAPVRDRTEIGASVLIVLVFRPGLASEPIACDVAPALRDKVAAWLVEREGACAVPGEREHAMVVEVAPVIAHRAAELALAGALGGESTRSLALVPVLDDDGEAAGWMHLEWEHHLQPSRARLLACAERWRDELASRRGAGRAARASSTAPSIAPRRTTARGDDDPRAAVFRALIEDIGMKTAQRRWWGFDVDEARGEWQLVAEGGEAVGLAGDATGEHRALSRAAATLGCVVFDEPDARLSIDSLASAGVVLPLRAAGRVCGLLSVESSRRRDFKASDAQRLVQCAQQSGLALQVARFRAWHREAYGFDVWFDAARAAFATPLLIAARSRAPIVLRGPAGAGKLVSARWLHFASAARHGMLHVHACSAGGVDGSLARLFESAAGGSLVLDGLEHLDRRGQEELAQWLEEQDAAASPGSIGEVPAAGEGEGAPPRILATTAVDLATAVHDGALRPELASRLDRLQLAVPALRERREDIPGLVSCMSARFAAAEGVRSPRLSDAALALLWRQRWEGNVRELENFVYKLALFSAGDALEVSAVAAIARQFHVKLERKLPSRHPERADLVAALRVTRTAGGRPNKTRAALYLGWDPDTLVARMSDAGITDESFEIENACNADDAIGTEGVDAADGADGADAGDAQHA